MEGSWASLGLALELLGALSGILEAFSGALGAVLGPSCGSLRRLKTQIDDMSKTYKTYRTSTFLGGRRAQDAAKLGQVRRKKGPSWHLEAILEPRWPKMAKMALKMRLESAKMPFWRRLGSLLGVPWARLGASWGSLGSS